MDPHPKSTLVDDLLELQRGSQGVVSGTPMNSLGLSLRPTNPPDVLPSGPSRQTRKGSGGTALSEGIFAMLVMPGFFLLAPLLIPLEKILSNDKVWTFVVYVGGGIGFLASLDSSVQSWGTTTLASFNIPKGLNNIIVSFGAGLAGAGLGALCLRILDGLFAPVARFSALILSFAIYLGLSWVSYHIYLNYFSGTPISWLDALFAFIAGQLSV